VCRDTLRDLRPAAALRPAAGATVPALDESLSLKSVRGAQISPGALLAYSATHTNWDEDYCISRI
jgi:hypothetical protein